MIFLFPRWDMLVPWRVYIYIILWVGVNLIRWWVSNHSGQILATSHDDLINPKWWFSKENPRLFQGNLGEGERLFKNWPEIILSVLNLHLHPGNFGTLIIIRFNYQVILHGVTCWDGEFPWPFTNGESWPVSRSGMKRSHIWHHLVGGHVLRNCKVTEWCDSGVCVFFDSSRCNESYQVITKKNHEIQRFSPFFPSLAFQGKQKIITSTLKSLEILLIHASEFRQTHQ